MAVLVGEDIATILLRALPADAAETLLGKIGGPAAESLRAKLEANPTTPNAEELDTALTEFFDIQRILERANTIQMQDEAERQKSVVTPTSQAAKIDHILADFPAERIAQSLIGEPPAAVALILSGLDPTRAGAILKSLPQAMQADAALRLAQPAQRNHALIVQLARALADKGRKLADAPPEPSPDERVKVVAGMLRALPRDERLPIMQRIEDTDAELAARIRESLYLFEDILRVEDRPLQPLLSEIDMKTLALALRNAEPNIVAKIINNISTRGREVLNEERELVAGASASKITEARAKIVALLRQYEETGKITIET